MESLNNPLKQYFRRPSVYVRLPSGGKFYDNDVVTVPENGEIPVYPMTAIDDITAKTPDALFNGQAMIDIIKSCIPSVKDPWKLNSMDFDALIIAIKSASSEEGMSIASTCTNTSCGEETSYKLDLSRLLADIKPADYDQPLLIGDLKIFFKPLTYKEMNDISMNNFEMQKFYLNIDNIEDIDKRTAMTREALTKITQITMDTLSSTIRQIVLPNGMSVEQKEFIFDYLQNCEKSSYDLIRDKNLSLKESGEIKPIKFKCPKCSHQYNQKLSLNLSDFFG